MAMFERLPIPASISRKTAERFDPALAAHRRQKKLAFWSGAIALGVSLYDADVRAHQQIEATSQVSIAKPYNEALNPEYNDRAIVMINGFGNYDARDIVESIGTELQPYLDGRVWGLTYGNAPLVEKRNRPGNR